MREKQRETKTSFSVDFTRFFRWELSKPRVKAALRYESYAWVLKSQDVARVQGSSFHENGEKAVSKEITLFEVWFFSYLV